MAKDNKPKGNKRELNGKIEKVDPSLTRNGWIRSEDKALEDKRAKDLRKARYQSAQSEIARERRVQEQEAARQKQASDERHAAILEELRRNKR
jgi:hypothetical protein